MTERVLIIDDDTRLSGMLSAWLGSRGFEVESRPDATSGLAAIRPARFDALVLDVMLPDLDGFEVLRRVRAESDLPVIMLTARGDETDRIVGLEMGADDYLPKPFNPRELLARLRAVLRRQGRAQSAPVLRFGPVEIDGNAKILRVNGEERRLTSYQFNLLAALASRAGRVQTREQLMELAGGDPEESFDRSIDVHISRIRAAVEEDPKNPRYIRTVRGAGYLFAG